MKAAVHRDALSVDVYSACVKCLKTHIAVPGVVGSSLISAKLDDARKVDVRYLRGEVDQWLSEFMKSYGAYKAETANVLTYREGMYYDWHRDGSGVGYRKYSFISVLSPKDQYEGGELEIEGVELPEYAFDPLSIIIFNPALRHRVKPVTRGVRHSLVTWFMEK